MINKKKIVIVIVSIIAFIFIVPNVANRIRYGIEELTGNVDPFIDIEAVGIAKIENDYPSVDSIFLEGESLTISKKQTKGAEGVYIYGTIVNSFERPELELNGVKSTHTARMSNERFVSAFRSVYIYRGYALDLDVEKLKSKNTVIIRCNNEEEEFTLYMN